MATDTVGKETSKEEGVKKRAHTVVVSRQN
jgi:hypothetical protein